MDARDPRDAGDLRDTGDRCCFIPAAQWPSWQSQTRAGLPLAQVYLLSDSGVAPRSEQRFKTQGGLATHLGKLRSIFGLEKNAGVMFAFFCLFCFLLQVSWDPPSPSYSSMYASPTVSQTLMIEAGM